MKKRHIRLAVFIGALMLMTACGSKEPHDIGKTPDTSGSEVTSGTDVISPTEDETGTEPGTEITTEPGTENNTEGNTEPGGDGFANYTFVSKNETMWSVDALNVRDLPNSEGERIGQLVKGQEVKVTGQCNETSWYRIEYNGKKGYVSNQYLSATKPVTDSNTGNTVNATVDERIDVLGKTYKKVESIYVIGNAAYESFGHSDKKAQSYGALINQVAEAVKGTGTVYCMPIPLGSGVVLPDEYKGKISVGDQKSAISSILGCMSADVVGVNIYDTLYAHKDEYLYFRTDHHWTQLGAYYAYTKFCEAKGIAFKTLDQFKHASYDGFVGSFYFNHKPQEQMLYNSPDIVYTYAPTANAKMTVTDKNGKSFDWAIINNVSNYKAGVKYSCFIAGDNPYTVIKNSDITDGSSCLIVKESFGNAFVPFLVDHYQTVHVIDARYWDGNLINFIKENGVKDVIFANNLSAIESTFQQGKLKGILD